MKFATEDLIKAVIGGVKKMRKIDPRYIFTLGWSSGGPPCYSASLTPGVGITGTFVAMSVFQPKWMPLLDGARAAPTSCCTHRPTSSRSRSRNRLATASSRPERRRSFARPDRGHGWHGDVYGNIRAGIQWLRRRRDVGSRRQPIVDCRLRPANLL